MDNIDREKRAGVALRAYPGFEEEDISSSIVDLVSDLLHLARSLDIEPDYVTHMAQGHFDTEVAEAIEDEIHEDFKCAGDDPELETKVFTPKLPSQQSKGRYWG